MPNITKAFTRYAKCEKTKKKQEFYDDTLKGFILEVKQNNRKTFYLRVILKNGKRKYIKIGDGAVINADEARVKALKLKKDFELRDSDDTNHHIPTLKEFYKDYYLPYIKKHVKSYKSNDATFRNHILPVLGDKPMDKVKKIEIMKFHTDLVDKKHLKPSSANKFLIFLSQAYRLAKDFELEGVMENPVRGVKLFEENNERQRFLTKKETKRLLISVCESENPHLKYIIPMLILTGARRGEVLQAKWCDFDEINMHWIIPTGKSGKKRVLPLTPAFYDLYKQIPKISNIYLFPSPFSTKPYKSVYSSWNNARKKAGLKDVRMHDLRHSFASALVNGGRSLYEVQTLLGHSTSKMTQRYAHLSNNALMQAASCAQKLIS